MARGRTVPSDAPRMVARQPFDYGRLALDRGQVFTLAGAPNDEKLTRLGYVIPLERDATTYECGKCGGVFNGIAERTAHGKKRHPDRVLTPEEEDERDEREERMLDQAAPLYMDKTKAAMGAA
jgi:hypothetical protein